MTIDEAYKAIDSARRLLDSLAKQVADGKLVYVQVDEIVINGVETHVRSKAMLRTPVDNIDVKFKI